MSVEILNAVLKDLQSIEFGIGDFEIDTSGRMIINDVHNFSTPVTSTASDIECERTE